MEQLAQFVSKSFEYNNNRVLDLLNVAIQVDINRSKSSYKSNSDDESLMERDVDKSSDNQDNNEESVEINITDLSGANDSPIVDAETHVGSDDKESDSEKREENSTSPLPLLKKNNNNNNVTPNNLSNPKKCVTKNWLISDTDNGNPSSNNDDNDNKSSDNNQKVCNITDENIKPKNLSHPNISLSKSSAIIDIEFQLRPKPVTELLKEIRKFHELSPPPLSTRLDNNYESRSSSPVDNEQSKGLYFL